MVVLTITADIEQENIRQIRDIRVLISITHTRTNILENQLKASINKS